MSQFKRFNASEHGNWNTNNAYPPGTLTWDPDNGLRVHDGSTGGGNAVGSSNFYDLTNRPTGNTAVHDLQGGSNSAYNGYFLKQTSTGVSEWSALPTTYDTLTIDTKIIGGIDGSAGTQITGIEASLGSGAPWRYAFIGGNDAFGNLFNRGNALIGWKIYPASDPSAFVTITEFLETTLGAPSLGFSGSLGNGPWIAESSDYNAGSPGPLTLSANSHNVVLGADGKLTLPQGMDISQSLKWTYYNSEIYEDGGLNIESRSSGISLYAGNDIVVNVDDGGVRQWKFKTDGSTDLPSNLRFGENGENADISTVYADTPVRILVTNSNTPALHIWQLGVDGKLTFPDSTQQTTAWTGTLPAPANGDSVNGNADLVFYDGTWNYTSRVTFNPSTTTLTLNGNSGTGGVTFPDGTTQTTAYTGGGTGSSLYEMKSANFTAEAGKTYWLDSGTSAKTVTLPASPTAGDWVKIYDGSLNWTTYNLTVSGNGNQIKTVSMMGAPSWNSAANSVTLNQNAISPNGPLAAVFIWNGTNWYSAA